MENALEAPSSALAAPAGQAAGREVLLAGGDVRRLEGLSRDELLALQWAQERQFAAQILAAPKGSTLRSQATHQAYDTVTSILAAAQDRQHSPLVMGLHPRQVRLVLDLLRRQRRRRLNVRFFEIGYGAGMLLEEVRRAGFPFAGIEVSAAMQTMAVQRLGPEARPQLHVGNFLDEDRPATGGPWSLVYWNDVFEHIPPDEIGDWLARIHHMLAPGGQLLTITPNWHVRPSDVTVAFCPPRTAAAGLHLKEYTLREVRELLRRAGFQSIVTPLAITRGRMVLCGSGGLRCKCLFEPALEWLPFGLARLLSRGMGLNCTIATKT